MQMLGNLGQNETYIFSFPPCPKIVSAPLRGANILFIDVTNKFSNFQKKIGILLVT